MALVVKNAPANAQDIRDMGSVSGSGKSPGGGHGNTLQYSSLENPMDRGAWRATVHRVSKNQARLKQLRTLLFNRSERINWERTQCFKQLIKLLTCLDLLRMLQIEMYSALNIFTLEKFLINYGLRRFFRSRVYNLCHETLTLLIL